MLEVLSMIHREHRQQKKTGKGHKTSHIKNMKFQTDGTENSFNQSPFYTVNKIFLLSTDTRILHKTFTCIVNLTTNKLQIWHLA